MTNFKEQLDAFVESIPTIPTEKKYWLVRTKSGELYDTFRENNIVALNHNEISLFDLDKIKQTHQSDSINMLTAIKAKVRTEHERRVLIDSEEELNLRKSSLIASQIFKFAIEMKKGDTVLIPSFNSDIISFGIVKESFIGDFTPEELRKIDTEAILKKRVRWVKDLKRLELDPYLYKMFTAHQAINEVGSYADVIERSISDFFILDNEAHTVINVQNEEEISAVDLFRMGVDILEMVDIIANKFNLEISSKDIQLTINLNSPGKIDLKSKIKSTTILLGLILLVAGGGYEDKAGNKLKTDGLPGIIKAIDEVVQNNHNRKMQEQIVVNYKDSIKVKNPEDLLRLLKQFDSNQDIPK
jgi:predicted Mrr-cat superfamily restriction endonuclease